MDSESLSILFLSLGVIGQILFFARTFWQWMASERAGQVVIPRGFWPLSLTAALFLLAYALWKQDPVFVAGPLVSASIFGRNVLLTRREVHGDGGKPTPLWILGPAALALLALVAVHLSTKLEVFDVAKIGAVWLVVGVVGQSLWQARNVIQWWVSEREGKSVLPLGYFVVALVGGLFMLAYALSRMDPVFIVSYLLSPIPYGRNLILLLRKRRQGDDESEDGGLEPQLPDPAAIEAHSESGVLPRPQPAARSAAKLKGGEATSAAPGEGAVDGSATPAPPAPAFKTVAQGGGL